MKALSKLSEESAESETLDMFLEIELLRGDKALDYEALKEMVRAVKAERDFDEPKAEPEEAAVSGEVQGNGS